MQRDAGHTRFSHFCTTWLHDGAKVSSSAHVVHGGTVNVLDDRICCNMVKGWGKCSHMNAVNVKLPNWGAGFRAPAIFPPADFLQTSSLGPDLVVDDLVCLGGIRKCVSAEKLHFAQSKNEKCK